MKQINWYNSGISDVHKGVRRSLHVYAFVVVLPSPRYRRKIDRFLSRRYSASVVSQERSQRAAGFGIAILWRTLDRIVGVHVSPVLCTYVVERTFSLGGVQSVPKFRYHLLGSCLNVLLIMPSFGSERSYPHV